MADKWEGKTEVELKGVTADQVWPCFEDFCSIHKWFPKLETCYRVEGEEGQPGLVRYSASVPQPASGETTVYWAKEKLLMINPIERCLRYEVIESNMGFKSYVAAFKVLQGDGDGCKIEWSFVSDPMEGWRLEDIERSRKSTLEFMAKKIEDAVAASSVSA